MPIEQQIMEYIWSERSEYSPLGYCRTAFLAKHLGMPSPNVYRILRRMVRSGLIEKCPRYSAVNCLSWRLMKPLQ